MLKKEKLEAMKLLKKEFEALKTNPITSLGVTVGLVKENNIFQWKISMVGRYTICWRNIFLTSRFSR